MLQLWRVMYYFTRITTFLLEICLHVMLQPHGQTMYFTIKIAFFFSIIKRQNKPLNNYLCTDVAFYQLFKTRNKL